MKLLDLFCGAGGCSVGYARAGFDVTGVDIEPHPDYPYEIVVADALEYLDSADLDQYDVIAASPPCPRYSTITPDACRANHPDLIGPVRSRLNRWAGERTGRHWVIENVTGARRHMYDPATVCGSTFGLAVRRHRLFESNTPIASSTCHHNWQGQVVGVYGSHPDRKTHLRPDGTSRGVKATSLEHAKWAMGIDWMTTWADVADAIPPAYTEFIGRQLIEHVEGR